MAPAKSTTKKVPTPVSPKKDQQNMHKVQGKRLVLRPGNGLVLRSTATISPQKEIKVLTEVFDDESAKKEGSGEPGSSTLTAIDLAQDEEDDPYGLMIVAKSIFAESEAKQSKHN